VLAILHFWWMRAGKQDFAEVSVYAGIVLILLGWRVRRRWLARQAGQALAGAGRSGR
jgi:sulfoxide reductase heme-binding subunit YedZ